MLCRCVASHAKWRPGSGAEPGQQGAYVTEQTGGNDSSVAAQTEQQSPGATSAIAPWLCHQCSLDQSIFYCECSPRLLVMRASMQAQASETLNSHALCQSTCAQTGANYYIDVLGKIWLSNSCLAFSVSALTYQQGCVPPEDDGDESAGQRKRAANMQSRKMRECRIESSALINIFIL